MDPTKVGKQTQYTQVVGVRGVRRLPRVGIIRLGKKHPEKGYPMDLTYFLVPPEVAAVYGTEPRELDVIIPVEDPRRFFPFAMKWYAASSLVCKGDGQTAERANSKVDEHDTVIGKPGARRTKVKCPCGHLKTDENPKGECTLKAILMVMIPKVSMGGVYWINTQSINNVIEINSCVAVERLPDPKDPEDEGEPAGFLRALFGHVALIPLKLRRVERDVEKPDGKRVKKWLLQLTTDANMSAVQAYRDGAVLALRRSNQLALPEPDRDITDDRVPIDVTDMEDVKSGPAVGGASPPSEAPPAVEIEKPPAAAAADSPPAGSAGAPPAQASEPERQPGEDREEDQSEEAKIRAAINGAKTMDELDAVWRDRVLKNKELDGTVKFALQDLLLERKKYLKKFGKK